MRIAWLSSLASFLALALAAGCSQQAKKVAPPPARTVAISPPSATLDQLAAATFTAQVTGLADATVSWSVTPAGCGAVAAGVFTAPAHAGICTLVATSAADGTLSARADLTVRAVAIVIDPVAIELGAGNSASFSAAVTGTTDRRVSWALAEGDAAGTINGSGRYTAPAAGGIFHVVASSMADSLQTATSVITVDAAPTASVSVAPAQATLDQGATVQLSATVTNAADTSVIWSVQPQGGAVSASGLYSAPAAAGSYLVVATSAADLSKSASAAITVREISVAVTPPTAHLAAGAASQLSAQLTGSTDLRVNWSVAEGSAGGSITNTGFYTAPLAAGTFHAIAASVSDSTKSAAAVITVDAPLPVSVSVAPSNSTIDQGATLQLAATVANAADTSVTWLVQPQGGAAVGMVSSGGLYTAPSAAGTRTITATSAADNTKSASASATVTVRAVAIGIAAPTAVPLPAGGSHAFSATVTGSTDLAVLWSVIPQAGLQVGSIDSTGHYLAPSNPGTFTIQAKADADFSKKATATATVAAVLPAAPGLPALTVRGLSTSLTFAFASAGSYPIASYRIHYLPLVNGVAQEGTEALQGSSPICLLANGSAATNCPTIVSQSCGATSCAIELTGLFSSHDYQLWVSAVDDHGNEGPPAATQAFTTGAGITWMFPWPSDAVINAFTCPTASRCYLAGQRGLLARSDDGGLTFAQLDAGSQGALNPASTPIGQGGFIGLSFPDPAHPDIGYLTGDAPTDLSPTTRGQSPTCAPPIQTFPGHYNCNLVRKTVDGGKTWTDVSPQLAAYGSGPISCADLNVCWVAIGSFLMRTANGGQTWSFVGGSAAQPLPGEAMRKILALPDGKSLFALGTYDVWETTDIGVTWTRLVNYPNQSINGFDLDGDGLHALLGHGFGADWTASLFADGQNAGAFSPALGTAQYANAVKFTSQGHALAIGGGGMLYRTTDGGKDWSDVSNGAVPQQSFSAPIFTGALFSDDDHGFVWATQGGLWPLLLRTSDLSTGAPHWTNYQSQPVAWNAYRNMVAPAVLDANTAVIGNYSGWLVATIDGGKTTQVVSTGIQSSYRPGVGGGGGNNAVAFLSSSPGSATGFFVGGNNSIAAVASFALDRATGAISSPATAEFAFSSQLSGVDVRGQAALVVGSQGTLLSWTGSGAACTLTCAAQGETCTAGLCGNWTSQAGPTSGAPDFANVKFIDDSTALIAGATAGAWQATKGGNGAWTVAPLGAPGVSSGVVGLDVKPSPATGAPQAYFFTAKSMVSYDTGTNTFSQKTYPSSKGSFNCNGFQETQALAGCCFSAGHCLALVVDACQGASLLSTRDAGANWHLARGFASMPNANYWSWTACAAPPPTAGVPDPARAFLLSAGGQILRTDSGGE